LYRQRTLASVFGSAGPGDPSVALEDAIAAWRHYLANDNQGHGVVLIGHSQGAGLLRELVRREIDGQPAEELILSVMLIGTDVSVAKGSDVGGDFRSMKLCRNANQLRCIISYASFRSTAPPGPASSFGSVRTYLSNRRASANAPPRPPDELEIACTNPALLSGHGGLLEAYLPADMYAPPFDQQPNVVTQAAWSRTSEVTSPFVKLPGLLTARCAQNESAHFLEITVHGDSSDSRVDDILGDIRTPAGANYGLHLIDVHLAMGNLLQIVRNQAAVFEIERTRRGR
jgi:hypothetical protein